jgi:hypothetical protein
MVTISSLNIEQDSNSPQRGKERKVKNDDNFEVRMKSRVFLF